MTTSELLNALNAHPDARLRLLLPDGREVPAHFHVTEIGHLRKDFIDCGGTRRSSATCLLQTWVAHDEHHRLTAAKLAGIFKIAAPLFNGADLPVEIEHEDNGISQYPLQTATRACGTLDLHLGTKHTDCLAKDKCGIGPAPAKKETCCGPGCC